jgi:predicted nucleotidyltransferase
MGILVPIMGMGKSSKSKHSRAAPTSGLGNALFTATQQRVLGLLFGQPERSFFATELISLAGVGSGAVQRELQRLERSGLVSTHRLATQKHYQANPASPIFHELTGIIRKTIGLGHPLRQALASVESDIEFAFVYGSVAKSSDTSRSDIDLMIISESVSYSDVFIALSEVSTTLGRQVNPSIYTQAEFEAARKSNNAFVTRVVAQPKLWVFGNEHEFPA